MRHTKANNDPRYQSSSSRHGLDGFAITDHDTSEAVEYFRNLGAFDLTGVAVGGLLIIPG